MTAASAAERKRALRAEVTEARLRLSQQDRAQRSRGVADRVAALEAFARARILALYPSMGAEVDTSEIARRALAAGKILAWPQLDPGSRALAFARCLPEALVPGPLETRQPPGDAARVQLEQIDVILVPGVAFDAGGRRLGRGRGHYDATLAALPARAVRIGLAFEVQLVPEVPREAHDVRLDAVVTERRVLWTRPPGAAGGGPGG